jgi:molecular chaperone HtpG
VSESPRSARGTTITLQLKADMDEYLEDYRIRSLVQKYSNYLPFPILLTGERINQPTALWRQPKKDITAEQYAEFYKQISFDFQDPLHWEHIESEAPVQFRALIYIPRESPFPLGERDAAHGLKLYAQRVFIQDECKALLPGFLRFLKGVVESEDIPLNVSRESVQNDANIQKINKIISKRILEALATLAEKKTADYQDFWQQYGRFLKEGLSREFALRDKILPLLRFHSSREDEKTLVGLQQYVARKVEGQQTIYYLYGENMAQLRRSPHLEALRAAGMEVLLIDDPMDDLILSQQPSFEGLSWLNAESADLKIPEHLASKKAADDGAGEWAALVQKVKAVLQDRVQSVSFTSALQDSPCRFVNAEGGVSHAVRKMMISMGKGEEVLKRDLELNPKHALIQRLARQLESPDIEGEIKLLFHLACLLEGEAADPRELADLILGSMNREP